MPTKPRKIPKIEPQNAKPAPETSAQPAPTPALPAPIETPIPWDEIRDKYVDGMALDDLARLYNVSLQTIQWRKYREKWVVIQSKAFARMKVALEGELRHCFIVSILREAREYRDKNLWSALEPDVVSRCRTRCFDLASRLLGWEQTTNASSSKGKVIDV